MPRRATLSLLVGPAVGFGLHGGSVARLGAPGTPSSSFARTVGLSALIEPELYSACVCYDVEMEASLQKLRSELEEAQRAADARQAELARSEEEKRALAAEMDAKVEELQKSIDGLNAELSSQRDEAESLRSNLEATMSRAASNADAASRLEAETSRLLERLDAEQLAAAAKLTEETNAFKVALEAQSAEAATAKGEFERVEAEKRALREEMDAQISEAGRAAAEANAVKERLASELAHSKVLNEDYLQAIEQIARISATITKTVESTASF